MPPGQDAVRGRTSRTTPSTPTTSSDAAASGRLAPLVLAAALFGTLIKGLGYDHIFWGTDSVWYGSPQWQIEAFRRLEIPADMMAKHGFQPLGAADGAVKSAIFGYNSARLYKLDLRAAFCHEHRVLDRALPTADHEHTLAGEHAQVLMVARVRIEV